MMIAKRLVLATLVLVAVITAMLLVMKDKIMLGAEAYLYGYPLVMMETTRIQSAKYIGPENQLRMVRQFPNAQFKEVVRPNVDTLYTTAFISMKEGPWAFEMPANNKRYELMPFMDAWTNVFASPGTRTSGNQGGTYLLTGPEWNGQVPKGMTLLKSPTDMVWLIGRTQTNGTADFATVHELQNRLRLSKWPQPPDSLSASTDSKRDAQPSWQVSTEPSLTPVAQMKALNTTEFFNRLMKLMVSNPPSPEDAPLLARLAQLEIKPGQAVHLSGSNALSFSLGRWIANQRVMKALNTKAQDGSWSYPPLNLGRYGTDYNTRAAVAMVGLGANLPEDAMYPNTVLDHQGQALNGKHRYRLHFAANALPPVKAFWSITAYGADEFLIDNPLQRFAIGDRDPLVFNADGSLDLWVQATPPSQKEAAANWLPVQMGAPFLLNARLYWPEDKALNGQWKMPVVERLN
ncbi:MAG: DUF1254 domain-containing protein [Limnohabitans sp.]|nr:DUF1254 domain-containing protein [Limnohabitans sp.]